MDSTETLFIAYTIIIAFAMFLTRTVAKNHSRFELTPATALIFFSFLYNSAKPISIIFFDSPTTPLVEPFLIANILAAVGCLVGLGIYTSIHARPRSAQQNVFKIRNNRVLFAPLILALSVPLLIFAWSRYQLLDYNLANIFSAYGFEGGAVTDQNVFQVLSGQFGISAALYGFCVYYVQHRFKKRGTYLWAALIVAIAGFFLIRGSRNFAIMALLPAAAIVLYGRSIPVFRATALVVVTFVAFQFLAYARNFGINNVARMSSLELADFAPDNSELGTSFNVFSIYDQIGHYYDRKYGSTYTIDALINLIPRGLWKNRPYSMSEDFTRAYLNSENVSEGFGFSPIVEAIVNFGYWGIPFVFLIAAYFVCSLSDFLLSRGSYSALLSWAMMIPLIINWNRIDFSTTSKMYLIFFSLFISYDLISVRYFKQRSSANRSRKPQIHPEQNRPPVNLKELGSRAKFIELRQ